MKVRSFLVTQKLLGGDVPKCCTDKMLVFLDKLRKSGVANMFGAAPYLREEFGLSRPDSYDVLMYWMKTFDERHPRE